MIHRVQIELISWSATIGTQERIFVRPTMTVGHGSVWVPDGLELPPSPGEDPGQAPAPAVDEPASAD